MGNEDLKKRTIFGILWNGLGNAGSSLISFVSNIVLARLLLPSDFGCIAMLYVFMALSKALISGGFASALIQKKDPTKEDYNTVFYWNLVASIILYLVLFFSSPAISKFYNLPYLTSVLRVHAIALIVGSVSNVQRVHLDRELKFKLTSKIMLVSMSCGTITAIVMAFCGLGVWCLVASNIIQSVVGALLLWKMCPWRPSWCFSFMSFKELFSFGGFLALVSIINTLYGNVQAIIIGKKFSATDVGYFNQAKRLEFVPSDTVTMVVDQVTFPVFSKIRDDASKFIAGIRTNVKAVSFLNFALYVLLIIVAYPLIHFIYGDKWDASVPYFQILCLAGMVYSLDQINLNVIKSLGKGGVYFLTQIITRIVGISIMFVGMRWGIYGLLWSLVVSSYLNLLVSSVIRSRLVDYSLFEQIKDLFPTLLLALLAGVVTWAIGKYVNIHFVLLLIVQSFIYCAVYLVLSYLFKLDGYRICKDATLGIIKQKRRDNKS